MNTVPREQEWKHIDKKAALTLIKVCLNCPDVKVGKKDFSDRFKANTSQHDLTNT